MEILICGLGSIGRRHARLIRGHFPHEVFALRLSGRRGNDLGIPELYSWEEVDRRKFDVAFITNPTYLHIESALKCADRGMHLFIEKPIDCKLDGLDELLGLVQKRQLTAYVAYPFRHHPVLRELKDMLKSETILHARVVCSSFLPDWRSSNDREVHYSARKSEGGGALLDLSHEIDYAAFLFGDVADMSGTLGRAGDVTVDAEDYCDLILHHEHHVTNVHLSLFSRKAQRFIEVETERFFVRADLHNNRLVRVGPDLNLNKRIKASPDTMYVSQLNFFFDNLDHPFLENNLFEAQRLYRKIIDFKTRYERVACPS